MRNYSTGFTKYVVWVESSECLPDWMVGSLWRHCWLGVRQKALQPSFKLRVSVKINYPMGASLSVNWRCHNLPCRLQLVLHGIVGGKHFPWGHRSWEDRILCLGLFKVRGAESNKTRKCISIALIKWRKNFCFYPKPYPPHTLPWKSLETTSPELGAKKDGKRAWQTKGKEIQSGAQKPTSLLGLLWGCLLGG